VPTPTTTILLSRRSTLRLAGYGVVAVSALSACSTDGGAAGPSKIDPLIAQADRARTDAAAATAAVATIPDRGTALGLIAAERTEHAKALDTEIARALGVYSDGSPPSADSAAISSATTETVSPPTLDQLRTRIADSQRGSAALAATESDYRAGLLGSISAACGVHVEVLLR
jgi:hypothetical protein